MDTTNPTVHPFLRNIGHRRRDHHRKRHNLHSDLVTALNRLKSSQTNSLKTWASEEDLTLMLDLRPVEAIIPITIPVTFLLTCHPEAKAFLTNNHRRLSLHLRNRNSLLTTTNSV